MELIDEIQQLDLIRDTEVPRRFRFRHPLVRRAVYDNIPRGWRLGAHKRCAEALAARGAPATVRAHHVEHAAPEGDLGAIETLRQAGEASSRLAPASAARWFGSALRLLPAGASSEDRAGLLLARAGCYAATGALNESRADLLAALELSQQSGSGSA